MTLGTARTPGQDGTHFDKPTDVAIGADGTIYVSDGYGNNRVARFSPDGKFLGQWGSNKGDKPGEFNLPHSISIDAEDRVYVADRENRRVQIFDHDGKFLSAWKSDELASHSRSLSGRMVLPMLWMAAIRSRHHRTMAESFALILAVRCWTVGAAMATMMGKFTSVMTLPSARMARLRRRYLGPSSAEIRQRVRRHRRLEANSRSPVPPASVAVRTRLIEFNHQQMICQMTAAAFSSSPKISNPSAPSNSAELTTRLPRSRKKTASAESSPTPAATTRKAWPMRRGRWA